MNEFETAPETSQRLPRWLRYTLFGLGVTFFIVGVLGLVLPLVPGAAFLILSAACFARSSPRFERWLLEHKWFGPPIRDWRDGGAIPKHIKWIAAVSMAGSLVMMTYIGLPSLVIGGLAVTFIAATLYIMTRPEPKRA